MIRIASAAVLLLGFAGSAQAYELRAKAESTLTTVQELSELVHKIGDEAAHNVPDSDQIRVHVISEARPRANTSEILYNHRIELRKLFDGRDTPPYPVGGWFVIYTSETYGIGTPEKAKAELESTIRKFFVELRKLNPKTDAP
jgi:hypothetical protein